jgi:signal transduction histidine kinase/ActR/RegA family two-component response regulator
VDFLPPDHRIIEKQRMDFQPFGRTADGKRIDDISGVSMRVFLNCLEEIVMRKRGGEAARHALDELVRLLNHRIQDSAYHVTLTFLKNPWNSYSHEFSLFLTNFCALLAEDPEFHVKVGKKLVPPMIRTLGRPFSVAQIFKMAAHFGAKYVKAIRFEPIKIEETSAILHIHYSDNSLRQFGVYRKACVSEICATIKAACSTVPEAVHDLLPASVKDHACVANGDPYCEWEFTWQPEKWAAVAWWWTALGVTLAMFIGLKFLIPTLSLVEVLLLSFIPTVFVFALQNRAVLRKELKRRGEIIDEQAITTDTRHEELREAYLEQEQRTADLRRAYHEIEELNIGLEAKVSQRTAELEAANTRLKDLDNLKSQFLAQVSHDLRTPLTAIQSFADNMLDQMAGPITDRQHQYLKRITLNSGRLSRMISNLLDQTRIESGRMDLSLANVKLRQLAQDVIEQMMPLAQAKEQALTLYPGPDLSAWGDEDKLHQVLTNLVDNAIKYTPQKGTIRIQIEAEVPTVGKLSVLDSGGGIPPEAQSKLFDLFYRVDNAQRQHIKGFGVGLSIVKSFVELHGGHVIVESEEGKGTAFHVTLPLAPQESGRGEVTPIKVQRILLVDDDPDIRQFVSERLERAGYSVWVAQTGPQALTMIASGQFDGLVLDIGLPELNGIEVLKSVRAQQLTMPVLIITAAEARDEALRAIEGGAQAYLLKPFLAGQFERVVAQCFERGLSHDPQVA